jgi:hypothetical protein
MSNLIEYIERQRAAGLTDYQILQRTKNRNMNHNRQVGGGLVFIENTEGDEPIYVQGDDQTGESTNVYFFPNERTFKQLDETGGYITIDYDGPTDGIHPELLSGMAGQVPGAAPFGDDQTLSYKDEGDVIETGASLSDPDPVPEAPSVSASTYSVIPEGTLIYHPSSDVSGMSSQNMLFVKLQDVLNMGEQRSFTMFFTNNKEYARRFAGLVSLNKRDVYVHTLYVKRDITNLKRIDSDIISRDSDHIDLGNGFCGPSADGVINGIEINRTSASGKEISEYYICNPEQFFEIHATDMQYDATRWVDITEKESIHIPDEQVPDEFDDFETAEQVDYPVGQSGVDTKTEGYGFGETEQQAVMADADADAIPHKVGYGDYAGQEHVEHTADTAGTAGTFPTQVVE